MTMVSGDVEQKLIFYVNGKKVEDNNPDPKETLLYYLRRKLLLPGSKLGCGEGGCGACTVMLSQFDRARNKICHISINACITPVVTVHGRSITTVEGIGNVGKDGSNLHPVQERIAKAHGSQCGFCTPGIVMSMYTLLRNNPSPTEKQVEDAFQGNLCRCTGYRPILDGFKTFAKSGCCGASNGNCCMNGKESSINEATALFRNDGLLPYDPSQEPIFPSELQMNKSLEQTFLHFSTSSQSWYRPVNMKQVLELKKHFPAAKLVVGNTELGVEANVMKVLYPIFISIADVPELKEINITKQHVTLGASVTLTTMYDLFQSFQKTEDESRVRPFAALLEMLHWFAGSQIRNVASIGGNIMTASPISDLNPILVASGATLVFMDSDGATRRQKMDRTFFKSYRRVEVSETEVLVKVEIPFTDKNTYIFGYKQAHRREDDISIVNAGIRVTMSGPQPEAVVEDLCAVFGGMAPVTKVAEKCGRIAIGRHWNHELLNVVLDCLSSEFSLDYGTPGGQEMYRSGLVLSFFFRFFWMVFKERGGEMIHDSAIDMIHRGLSNGSQFTDGVPTDQETHDPIGRPIVHMSGLKQATGEAVFVDDMPTYAHELFFAPVFSQRAHARILSVNTSKALTMEGVRGWVDHRDIPGVNLLEEDEIDGKILPDDEVTFWGQIIGGVVAVTKLQAQVAAKAVAVDYEDLPAVITIEDAIASNSFFRTFDYSVGDLHKGFEESETIVEGEVRIGGQEHFYLETHANLAVPKEGGEMEMYCSAQVPSLMQASVARALGIPLSLVNVRVRRLGGGFGGKENNVLPVAIPVAVAARKFGVPVRWMLDRWEDMLETGKRHPVLVRYRVGATKEGVLKALHLQGYFNAGHTKELSHNVAFAGILQGSLGYHFQNYLLESFTCKTNVASNTAFRGYGHPQIRYGVETCVRHMSEALGMRIDEIRQKNLYSSGDTNLFGGKLEACNVRTCLENVIAISDWKSREREVEEFNRNSRWKKRGIALMPVMYGCSFEQAVLNQGYALVNIYRDGSVLVSHGGVEMGQGLHTKMIMVASKCLGIDKEWIKTTDMSTEKTPNTSSTAASFSTDLNGRAVMDACSTLVKRLAPLRKAKPDLSWPGLIKAAYFESISLSTTGYHMDKAANFDRHKKTGTPFIYYSYGASCSEVEIDCLTGDHVVRRVDIVMDVGKSVNPAIDIGQIEGAFIQGYGLFTLEELRMSPQGMYYSNGPGNYKIPGFTDIPEKFNVHLLRDSANPHPRSVFSSKAVGEPPLLLSVGVPFALRNAIAAAREEVGLSDFFRLDSPVTSERIRMACDDKILRLVKEKMAPDTGSRWDIEL